MQFIGVDSRCCVCGPKLVILVRASILRVAPPKWLQSPTTSLVLMVVKISTIIIIDSFHFIVVVVVAVRGLQQGNSRSWKLTSWSNNTDHDDDVDDGANVYGMTSNRRKSSKS